VSSLPASDSAKSNKKPGTQRSVLIVDDDPVIRALIHQILEPLGCDIAEAPNGRVACEMCIASRPTVVVLDLVMPEQEGIETLRVLRREVPGIRIVAMSGALGGTFLRPAKLLGADAVLAKPFRPQELIDTITEVCGGFRDP
jgi:CheY-like chemotaxis protein